MPRIDRHACSTVQAHDARAVMRSGRLRLDPLEHDPAGLVVTVDGLEVGALLATDEGWLGFRPGWVDPCPRTRRRDALRRLLMSHPAGTFGVRPANHREGPR